MQTLSLSAISINNSKFFDNLVAELDLSIEVSDPAILFKL